MPVGACHDLKFMSGTTIVVGTAMAILAFNGENDSC